MYDAWDAQIVDTLVVIESSDPRLTVSRWALTACGSQRRGDVVGVAINGGNSPEEWYELSEDRRVQAVIKLLMLHQRFSLIHGDVKPTSTVVTRSATDPVGLVCWIDFSRTEEHIGAFEGWRCASASREYV
ncbi:hypothetical protein JCM10295v2_001937 [Rhodotorula toruloides]